MRRRTFLAAGAIGAVGAWFARVLSPFPVSGPETPETGVVWLNTQPLATYVRQENGVWGRMCQATCANMLPDLNGNRFEMDDLRSITRDAPGKPIYVNFDHTKLAGYVLGAKLVDRGRLHETGNYRHTAVELDFILHEDYSACVNGRHYAVVACIVNPVWGEDEIEGEEFPAQHRFESLLNFGLTDKPLDHDLVAIHDVDPSLPVGQSKEGPVLFSSSWAGVPLSL